MGAVIGQAMAEDSDLLLGRRTYDIFAAHWPDAGDDNPLARKCYRATEYVVTSARDTLDWENSQAITGDVVKGIARLKDSDGVPLSVQDSSQLIQTLLESDLFGWTFPVVLGSGERLFGSKAMLQGFDLVDMTSLTGGVTMARYRAAGDVKIGPFALVCKNVPGPR